MKQHSVKFNATINMIKQVCSVLFPLITVPYVTRVLSLDSYGSVSYAYSIISYFMLIAALGCSTYAIREGAMIRDNKNKFSKFCNEIFSITLISTVLSFLLLLILIIFVDEFRNIKSLLLLFSSIFILTTIGADWVNSIFEDFVYLTLRYIVFQFLSLIIVLFMVKNDTDSFWYAFSMVFAAGGANILNIIYIRRYVHLKPTLKINWKKHLKPIFILFFTSVAGTIYINSDITIIGLMKGNDSVAMYNVATKVYLVIKQLLIALIVAGVPRAAYYLGENKKREYRELFYELRNTMLIIIPPAIIGMIMLSKDIITFISGNKYHDSYFSFSILSIALFFACFAYLELSVVLIPYKKEKISLYASVISAIINVLLNIVLIPILDFNAAAITTLISEIIVFSIFYIYTRKYIALNISFKEFFGIIIGTLSIIVICILCELLFKLVIVRLITAISISVVIYLLILILFKNPIVYKYFNKDKKR